MIVSAAHLIWKKKKILGAGKGNCKQGKWELGRKQCDMNWRKNLWLDLQPVEVPPSCAAHNRLGRVSSEALSI